MYLIKGSARALLIGTGSGTPGLAEFVEKLAGGLPVEVVVTSADQVKAALDVFQLGVYGLRRPDRQAETNVAAQNPLVDRIVW